MSISTAVFIAYVAIGLEAARRANAIGHSALRLAGVLALICATGAAAQPQAPADSPSVLPDVLVEGQRAALRKRVEIFVRGMTKNPGVSPDESLVRWTAPMCFLAAGFDQEDRDKVSARLSQIASSASAPVVRPPCQANFIIVATSEPNRVLAAWYAKNRQLFGDASPSEVRRFLDEPQARPIRVWRNIDRGRVASMRYGHFRASNDHAQSSPFMLNAVLGFHSVFAIIDLRRSGAVTLNQVSDYVAMAGFSNVDLDADIGSASSILRLFADRKETQLQGLSSWDSAFLRALYQSDQTSRSQRLEITERVLNEVSR